MNKELFDHKNNRIDPAYPLVVETYQPAGYTAGSKLRNELERGFSACNTEILVGIPLPPGIPKIRTPKNAAVKNLVSAFLFTNKEQFEAWFTLFPPVSQRILAGLAIYRHIFVEPYEKDSEIPLLFVEQSERFVTKHINPKLNLNFLIGFSSNGSIGFSIFEPLFSLLRTWLRPPNELLLDRAVMTAEKNEVFSNALDIPAAWPLLCEALSENIHQFQEKSAIRSIPKKQLADLRSRCGYKNFSLQKDKAPDALDMAACFVLYMSDFTPKRPEDGQTAIKRMVETFFGMDEKEFNKNIFTYKWEQFEYNVLTQHLRRPNDNWTDYRMPPPSRFAFYRILKMIALDRRWFSAESLAVCYQYLEKEICFCSSGTESRISIKGSFIKIGDLNYESYYGEDRIYVNNATRYVLLVEPLFKAYCYLCAALGLLEITQTEPPLRVTSRGKEMPMSIYDSLDAVRITDFGRWCLGIDTERPERIEEKYEAIADKELLLVTVRGYSYEHTVFLNSIGIKLGDDRWRISPHSFIANCSTEKDITFRIEKFKQLIDANPPPHWERLFSRVLGRANWMRTNAVPAKVYHIGSDLDFAEEILKDPALSACSFRAEGRMLVVPDTLERKFFEFMAEHGSINSKTPS